MKTLTKKEIQQRVLQNGEPLLLSKFSWDEETRTFSSVENNLIFDFTGISDCTFNTGSGCTFNTDWDCTFNTGSGCTFNTDWGCTFNTDWGCTFKTDWDCTFNTGSGCTFNTGSGCTFKTGWNCTFKTGWNCTFKTGSGCTFNTGGISVALVNSKIQPLNNNITYILLNKIILTKEDNDKYYKIEDRAGNFVYIDGIVSEVIKDKGAILEVISVGQTEHSYIVEKDGLFAHGSTIKQAKDSLIYKITDRDTTEYDKFTLKTTLTFKQAIVMYRKITGSCETETKKFAEKHIFEGTKTIADIITITSGQYGSNKLQSFFKN